MNRATVEHLGDSHSLEIHVATAEDAIISKLEWYRKTNETSERQWDDVTRLLKLLGDTAVLRPRIHSCQRRSGKLRRTSVAAEERLGSYECHSARCARPLALEYSSDRYTGCLVSRCRAPSKTFGDPQSMLHRRSMGSLSILQCRNRVFDRLLRWIAHNAGKKTA
jgi:hypothetical protein